MSEELTPMDRMELWMSALNEAITNGTDNSFMPYNRYELWMKKLCEAILAKNPADPDVVQQFVEDWLDEHPEATTTVEDGAVTLAKLADAVKEHFATADDLRRNATAGRISAENLFYLQDYGYYSANLVVSGYVSSTNGSEGSNDKNARSNIYFDLSRVKALCIPLGYRVRFAWFSEMNQGGFIGASAYEQCGDGIINYCDAPSNAKYFRFTLVNNAVTTITSSALAELNQSVILYSTDYNISKKTETDYLVDYVFSDQLASTNSRIAFLIYDGYVTSNGNIGSSAKYKRTDIIRLAYKHFAIKCDPLYAMRISFYTGNGTGYMRTDTIRYENNGKYYIAMPNGANYACIDFHAKDWHDLTSTDATAIQDGFGLYRSIIPEPITPVLNDSARAAFVAYMNDMCEKIGMTDTTFVNASGLDKSNVVSARDELKMAIAVSGNEKALDIWSTHDREFKVGGTNPRTITVENNVYGAEPSTAIYKLLGGKGGSLYEPSESYWRKARCALYDVNGVPVAVALLCGGEWAYNHMPDCTHELLGMMATKMSGGTPTEGTNLAHLISDGGGYAAVPVPACSGAYLNSFSPSELLARTNALSNNASAAQTPASTTKTMTMLCALSVASDLQEVITLIASDVSSGSGSAFASGDQLTLEDALRIMMMESSNTLAETVGRHIGKMLLTTQRTL